MELSLEAAIAGPAPRPRLVFLDLDGTVVNGSHGVLESTVEAVRAVRRSGIPVCIATGRPYFAARPVLELLEADGVGMFFSGALIQDPAKNETVAARLLDRNDQERILGAVRESGLHAEWYQFDRYFIERPSELTTVIHRTYLPQDAELRSFETLLDDAVLKVGLVLRLGSGDEDRLERLRESLPGFIISQAGGAAHPDILFVNITHPDAVRDAAFDLITAHYGVTAEETAAFGDSDSDIPFLTRAGWGCAMANANERVRASAPFTTASVDDDGVGTALRRIFALS